MESEERLFGLNWNARTYFRILLVAAGMGFAIRGIYTGMTLDLLLGLLAVFVGGIGLIFERRE